MNHVQSSQNESANMKPTRAEPERLRERVEQVRDLVDNVRDRAEVAFRDKPYLVPVAAGAVGFGLGLLLGSKVTRFILFTAVGTVLSDTLGGEIKRLSRDFMDDMQNRLGSGGEEASAE